MEIRGLAWSFYLWSRWGVRGLDKEGGRGNGRTDVGWVVSKGRKRELWAPVTH